MQLCNPDDSRIIPFTDQQLKAMAELYGRGTTSRRLASIYGISQKAVLRRLRALGVRVRTRGSRLEAARLRGDS